MASVSVDDVRDVVNVSSAEVPDTKVLKMIKRAEGTLKSLTQKFRHFLASSRDTIQLRGSVGKLFAREPAKEQYAKTAISNAEIL